MDALAQMMVSTGIDEFVATHDWVWPVCEILHFFGMALLIGSVGLVDLRMLGIAKGVPIKSLERFIPHGVFGVKVKATPGFIFVAGNPVGGPQEYLRNLAFQIKIILIVIAGLNLLAFYVLGIARRADAVTPDGIAPASAKAVAVVSLVLWFGVIFFGRFIMYNDTLLYALGL
jgi:hypothetical protein